MWVQAIFLARNERNAVNQWSGLVDRRATFPWLNTQREGDTEIWSNLISWPLLTSCFLVPAQFLTFLSPWLIYFTIMNCTFIQYGLHFDLFRGIFLKIILKGFNLTPDRETFFFCSRHPDPIALLRRDGERIHFLQRNTFSKLFNKQGEWSTAVTMAEQTEKSVTYRKSNVTGKRKTEEVEGKSSRLSPKWKEQWKKSSDADKAFVRGVNPAWMKFASQCFQTLKQYDNKTMGLTCSVFPWLWKEQCYVQFVNWFISMLL